MANSQPCPGELVGNLPIDIAKYALQHSIVVYITSPFPARQSYFSMSRIPADPILLFSRAIAKPFCTHLPSFPGSFPGFDISLYMRFPGVGMIIPYV